jgi:exopolyphosphatase/guanosine-5'-triphosphate,3'-diphosphate pyrophosphatase
MSEAEEALGHPIEIISGIEEARLIYMGVTHSLPPNEGLRLVMDIGGGSTELILGQGPIPRALESLHLGCVRMTERFFPDGVITREAFEAARVVARLELRPIKAFFRGTGDIEAIGTSGTIISTERVASAIGIVERDLTFEALEALIEKVIEAGSVNALQMPGLSERRAQVWPGGLSILVELIGVLRIDRLKVSDGALREGLLYDLLGRLQHEDARERTVRAMARRYNVDEAQAQRVAETACLLLEQCAEPWKLTSPLAEQGLVWAARLHEIGLDISHDGYQRHGAYIAENADMPGFPRAEQRLLAFLIASQRHQIVTRYLKELPRAWREPVLRMGILLRLAVLMNRSRNDTEIPPVELSVDGCTLALKFDPEWLRANPLTLADLEREQRLLAQAGYELSYS